MKDDHLTKLYARALKLKQESEEIKDVFRPLHRKYLDDRSIREIPSVSNVLDYLNRKNAQISKEIEQIRWEIAEYETFQI